MQRAVRMEELSMWEIVAGILIALALWTVLSIFAGAGVALLLGKLDERDAKLLRERRDRSS